MGRDQNTKRCLVVFSLHVVNAFCWRVQREGQLDFDDFFKGPPLRHRNVGLQYLSRDFEWCNAILLRKKKREEATWSGWRVRRQRPAGEERRSAALRERESKAPTPTTQLVFMFAAHDVVCVQLSSKERHISRIELNYFHMIYHTYLC